MDPLTIAAGVGALLAPYLKKAAESFAGEGGKYVFAKAKEVWEKLRAKAAGDPQAKEALDRVERAPDADDARPELEAQVERLVAADTALRDELAAVLADVKRQAPHLTIVSRVKEAEEAGALKARRLARGIVDVTHEVDKAKKVTSVEIDEIG